MSDFCTDGDDTIDAQGGQDWMTAGAGERHRPWGGEGNPFVCQHDGVLKYGPAPRGREGFLHA